MELHSSSDQLTLAMPTYKEYKYSGLWVQPSDHNVKSQIYALRMYAVP
jgi:hypothetical protein